MSSSEISLAIEGVSAAEAARQAQALRQELQRTVKDVQVEQRRDKPNAQDFGATLVLILGAPAVVELARAIHAYMKRAGTSIVIRKDGKTVRLSGLESKDVAAALQAAMEESRPRR